jgi:hypothetical protein
MYQPYVIDIATLIKYVPIPIELLPYERDIQ